MTLQAQDHKKELKENISQVLKFWTVENYRPSRVPDLSDVIIQDSTKTIVIIPNESFFSQPFDANTPALFQKKIEKSLPKRFASYHLVVRDANGKPIDDYIPNYLRKKKNVDQSRLWKFSIVSKPWVTNISQPITISEGLEGRHIALWPSHGIYYKQSAKSWLWQRPRLFCTSEDLFTQSIVNPFLIPMLENSGAIVFTPRERDIQTAEIIVDNDKPQFNGSFTAINYLEERGIVTNGYLSVPSDTTLLRVPSLFHSGSAILAATTKSENRSQNFRWTPFIRKSGQYAVYVTYPFHENNVEDAHYSVTHCGITTDFTVNQRMGCSTWVYLGTFNFNANDTRHNYIELSNVSATEGYVCADAVRIGGGMGNILRGDSLLSGFPRFLESARYAAAWSGLPASLYNSSNNSNDYNDDIRVRPYYVNHLAANAYTKAISKRALGVPFELALAVHSDAGYKADNSIYGTLSIYTSKSDNGSERFPYGMSRETSGDFSEMLQSNITTDLSKFTNTTWYRREHWNRNYGETRLTDIPAVILETMSHQNYADLKWGHDPLFKFTLARSIYKSVVQYVSYMHGKKSYEIAPLPVSRFACMLRSDEKTVELSWMPQTDTLTQDAQPDGYIVYTKKGIYDYDNGTDVGNTHSYRVTLTPDVQYSFKVVAYNKGGVSYPSEELTALCANKSRKGHHVLIVDGFTRLSGPARIEKSDSLGFDLEKDLGVPYGYTAEYCGKQVSFDPAKAGGETYGSLGYSTSELEGKIIVGNTRNHAIVHGQAITGVSDFSFSSCTKEAFEFLPNKVIKQFDVIDYIAGLEHDVPYNSRPCQTFSPKVKDRLTTAADHGVNILVSGSYIGTDDSSTDDFVGNTLRFYQTGRKHINYNTPDSLYQAERVVKGLNISLPLLRLPNDRHYHAADVDCIYPIDAQGFSAFAYSDGRSAGIAWPGKRYRVIATGFPFECIDDSMIRMQSMKAFLHFLCRIR